MIISKEDQEFVHFLMRKYRIKAVKITFSNSSKKFPDLWISDLDKNIPIVTVTREWQRQSSAERQKRLVHELVGHYYLRLNDNIKELSFYSRPEKDVWSKKLYMKLTNK